MCRAPTSIVSPRRGCGLLPSSVWTMCLGVGGLALCVAEHAGAILVGALVGGDVFSALLVVLSDQCFDFGDREIIVAGPWLLAPQRGDVA